MNRITLSEWFDANFNYDGANASALTANADETLLRMLLCNPETRWLIESAINAEWEAFVGNAYIEVADNYLSIDDSLKDVVKRVLKVMPSEARPFQWKGEHDYTYSIRVINEYHAWYYRMTSEFALLQTMVENLCYHFDNGNDVETDFASLIDELIKYDIMDYDGFYRNFMGKDTIGEDYYVENGEIFNIKISEREEILNAIRNLAEDASNKAIDDTTFTSGVTNYLEKFKAL